MQISEIRVKLVGHRTDRLKAFSSVTFDNSFVVRDLKIIEGSDGYFVAMPSRKLMDRCHGCGCKNHLRAKFCNECGARLENSRSKRKGAGGRIKIHADIAHPINSQSREYIQREVVKAFERELELSQQPGYKPAKIDDYDDGLGVKPKTTEPKTAEPGTGEPESELPTPPAEEPSVGPSAEVPPEPAGPSPDSEPERDDSDFSQGIV